jgi:hypothetical protein
VGIGGWFAHDFSRQCKICAYKRMNYNQSRHQIFAGLMFFYDHAICPHKHLGAELETPLETEANLTTGQPQLYNPAPSR